MSKGSAYLITIIIITDFIFAFANFEFDAKEFIQVPECLQKVITVHNVF
jgi:hypothetical protein